MLRKSHIKIIAVLVLVVALVGFIGLQRTTPTSTLKIGLVLPLTGPAATWGNDYLQGATIAIEDLNAAGIIDRPIELVIEDTMSEPKNAVTSFQKLINVDKVKFVATTLSSHGLAMKPLAEENHIILFGDVAHPAMTQNTKFTFRHSNIVDDEAKKLADQVIKLQAKKVGILYSNDEYGYVSNQEILQHLATAKIATQSEAFDLKDTDFKTEITKMIDADALIVVGLGSGFNIILQQIKELGFEGTVLTGIAFVVFKSSELGNVVDGVYHTDFPYISMHNWQEFSARYKKKYNLDPKPYHAISYGTMELLVTTIAKAESDDPTKVAKTLRAMKEFRGTYETIVLNEKGDALIPLILIQHKVEK